MLVTMPYHSGDADLVLLFLESVRDVSLDGDRHSLLLIKTDEDVEMRMFKAIEDAALGAFKRCVTIEKADSGRWASEVNRAWAEAASFSQMGGWPFFFFCEPDVTCIARDALTKLSDGFERSQCLAFGRLSCYPGIGSYANGVAVYDSRLSAITILGQRSSAPFDIALRHQIVPYLYPTNLIAQCPKGGYGDMDYGDVAMLIGAEIKSGAALIHGIKNRNSTRSAIAYAASCAKGASS